MLLVSGQESFLQRDPVIRVGSLEARLLDSVPGFATLAQIFKGI